MVNILLAAVMAWLAATIIALLVLIGVTGADMENSSPTYHDSVEDTDD